MSTGAPSATGRIVCSQCGANNFQTQAACWKCGASLFAASPTPAAGSASAAPGRPSASVPHLPSSPPVDPTVASISAIVLAALFPYIALPVGIVFLMLDDRRKIEVGRVAIVAGLIFTIAHTLFFAWLTKAAVDQVKGFLPNAGGIAGQIQQQRQPKMTDELPSGFPTP